MDLSPIFGSIGQALGAFGISDTGLVLGIIVVFGLARWVIKKAWKIELNDLISRLIVLGLGMACAFIKIDYKDSLGIEIVELIGKAFSYGGAATIAYQVAKPLLKMLFPADDAAQPPAAGPTPGTSG
jgi:hypothetical protein